MSRVIRTIEAFYEVGSPHAVDPAHAREIFGTAQGLISQYVGPVAIASIRGARIPLDDRAAVEPLKLRLSNARHTALVTGRPTAVGHEASQYGGVTSTVTGYGGADGSSIAVTAPLEHLDKKGEIAVDVLVHEYGHSFGLAHCATALCVMNAKARYQPNVTPPRLTTGRPFCDPCAGDLELAGYMALARQL